MKCSFGISDFLEEIPSLSHSVVFLYFFALIAEEGFLISSYYSLELCIQMFISFLFSNTMLLTKCTPGTSLVVQWLRLPTPSQGTWVQSLVRKLDSACHN